MNTPRLSLATVLRDPLVAARTAERALGYVGLDLPEEVLAATGGVCAHLPWQRADATPFADRWLEDAFPGWARSILEGWAAGDFDFLPAVVFSRGDDVSQRLYYYVCELQRQGLLGGPAPLVFDVAHLPRSTSIEHTRRAVTTLAADLGLEREALVDGIRLADARRARLDAHGRDRSLRGRCREHIARASLFAPLERLDIETVTEPAHTAGRVLLAGSAPPDDALHLAVEAAGWTVAGEVHARSLDRLGPPLGSGDGDPAHRIAAHIADHPRGPRGWVHPSGKIVAAARSCAADVVILWLFEEDEAFAWDVLGTRQALEATRLPTLVLARRRWDLGDEPQRDIGQFLEEVGR